MGGVEPGVRALPRWRVCTVVDRPTQAPSSTLWRRHQPSVCEHSVEACRCAAGLRPAGWLRRLCACPRARARSQPCIASTAASPPATRPARLFSYIGGYPATNSIQQPLNHIRTAFLVAFSCTRGKPSQNVALSTLMLGPSLCTVLRLGHSSAGTSLAADTTGGSAAEELEPD